MRSSSALSRRSMRNVAVRVATMLSPRNRRNHVKMFDTDETSDSIVGPVVVAFSGIFPSDRIKKFILDHGGDIIDSSDGIKNLPSITHLVVNNHDLKPRRIKFLVALCVVPENIVSYEWIEKSEQSNAFLPLDAFRINANVTAEKEYKFSLQRSISNAVTAVRNGGILSGRFVYVAPGVSGNKGPSKDEVAALVKASGAVYHSDISGVNKMIKNHCDFTKLIVISKSGRTLPSSAIHAIEEGALELEWGNFVTAILHQELGFNAEESQQISIIDDDGVIDLTQRASIQQEDVVTKKQFVKILCLKLECSPQRSVSDTSIGDPERAFLGSNGNLEVYKCVDTLETAVRYLDEEGTIKFESSVPSPADCHKAIQGNAGRDTCFLWDTVNTAFASGGTTIRGALNSSDAVGHRRHFFWFKSRDELIVVLYHMLGQNFEMVEEFFTEHSRFYASERTQPDHIVVKPNDAMEEDDIPLRAGFFGHTGVAYDFDPRGESQPI